MAGNDRDEKALTNTYCIDEKSTKMLNDKPVILFTGRPRIGKSTAINAILQRMEAKSAAGLTSVTVAANAYHDPKDPFILIDTPGLFAPDRKEKDYVDTVQFIRTFGRVHAVVLVVSDAITLEDQIAANWFKFALCSPFQPALKTHVLVTKIRCANDDQFIDAMKELHNDYSQFKGRNTNGELFGFRNVNCRGERDVVKGLQQDAKVFVDGLRNYLSETPVIPNFLSAKMEYRSFILSKAWLTDGGADAEKVKDVIKTIETESKWILTTLQQCSEILKEWIELGKANPSYANQFIQLAMMWVQVGVDQAGTYFRQHLHPQSVDDWTKLVNMGTIV